MKTSDDTIGILQIKKHFYDHENHSGEGNVDSRMEMAAQDIAGWRQMVCGYTRSDNA